MATVRCPGRLACAPGLCRQVYHGRPRCATFCRTAQQFRPIRTAQYFDKARGRC